VDTGTKEDKSSAGCVWAAGFHHVTARSRLARVLKLMNRLFPYPLLVPRSKNRVELYLYSPQGPSWPVKSVKPT
jgi:hypothetical protein